ncbi:MAG TPA: hypothetical protein VGG74_36280 [Kofleriaceae bacterium]
MTLRNFLLMIAAVGLMACGKKHDEDAKIVEKVPPPSDIRPAVPPPTPMPPLDAASQPVSDLAARPYDADVIAWRGKKAPKRKIKDAAPGASYKLDLYQDAGELTIDRAKVDANRNGKWDDKYTFAGDTITLEHAPADDEHYTEKYHWNGNGWTRAAP